MEGGAEAAVDPKPVAQSLPRGCGELRPAVGDYGVREAVEAEDVHHDHVPLFGGVDGGTAGDEVARFGEPVDDDPDGVVTLRPWQAGGKALGDVLPPVWNRSVGVRVGIRGNVYIRGDIWGSGLGHFVSNNLEILRYREGGSTLPEETGYPPTNVGLAPLAASGEPSVLRWRGYRCNLVSSA